MTFYLSSAWAGWYEYIMQHSLEIWHDVVFRKIRCGHVNTRARAHTICMRRHQLIGMTKEFDGVPSVPLVHKRLVDHLLFALRFIPTVAHARRDSSDSSM